MKGHRRRARQLHCLDKGRNMRPHNLRLSAVFLGGLMLISFGFASTMGLGPTEVLQPFLSVVGGLAVMGIVASSGGPRNLF